MACCVQGTGIDRRSRLFKCVKQRFDLVTMTFYQRRNEGKAGVGPSSPTKCFCHNHPRLGDICIFAQLLNDPRINLGYRQRPNLFVSLTNATLCLPPAMHFLESSRMLSANK
nr:hypothetical protein REQ54_04011 [Rhizobium sp. Q54]